MATRIILIQWRISYYNIEKSVYAEIVISLTDDSGNGWCQRISNWKKIYCIEASYVRNRMKNVKHEYRLQISEVHEFVSTFICTESLIAVRFGSQVVRVPKFSTEEFMSFIVRADDRPRIDPAGGFWLPGECSDWLLCRRIVGNRATNEALCLKLQMGLEKRAHSC